MMRPKPFVLITISGLGVSASYEGNAIRQANLPVLRGFAETYPTMTLHASGRAVGLDRGMPGTAAAGHRTIGLGYPWFTSTARVNQAIERGTFSQNATLRRMTSHVREHRSTLHLIGLASPSTKYADLNHVLSLLRLAKQEGVMRVALHLIIDGIDAPPRSSIDVIADVESMLQAEQIGSIASVSGRFFAMDHDGYWDRTKRACTVMAFGDTERVFRTAEEAVRDWHASGGTDDLFPPATIVSQGSAAQKFQDGDGIVFWNVRPYGIRQLVKACTLPAFEPFLRTLPGHMACVTLTEYERDIPVSVAFPPHYVDMSFGGVISEAGLKQLRVSEALSYVYVTTFLNGMETKAFPGEHRMIVQSSDAYAYDLAPSLGSDRIADVVVREIASGSYDVIIANFAAPDILAATGKLDATIHACEGVDRALGRIADAALAVGGAMIAVGDHGHAEELINPNTGLLQTGGTQNPVSCFILGRSFEGLKAPVGDIVGGDPSTTKPAGTLADVAPTALAILNLPIPSDMIGRPLMGPHSSTA